MALCSLEDTDGSGSGLLWPLPFSQGNWHRVFIAGGEGLLHRRNVEDSQCENKLTNQRLVWEGMNSSSPAYVRERGSSSQAVTGNATATSRGPQVVLTQCIQPLVPALHVGLEADPQSVLSAELLLCFSAAQPPRSSGLWASPGLCSGWSRMTSTFRQRRPDHSARNSGVRELHSSSTELRLLTS